MDRSMFGFSGSLDDLASIDEELKGFLADLDNQNYAQPFLAAGGDDQMTDIFADFLGGCNNEAAAPASQQAAATGTSLPANMPPGPSVLSLQQQMLGATQASWPSMSTSAPISATAPANSAPTSFFLDLPTQPPANFSRTITTGDTYSIPQQQLSSLPYHQPPTQNIPATAPQQQQPPQQPAWQPFGSLQPAAAPVQIKLESSGSGGAGGGSSGPGRKRKPGARKDPHKQKQEELAQQIQAMMAQLQLLQSENERLKMKHQVLEHVVEESGQHMQTLAAQAGQASGTSGAVSITTAGSSQAGTPTSAAAAAAAAGGQLPPAASAAAAGASTSAASAASAGPSSLAAASGQPDSQLLQLLTMAAGGGSSNSSSTQRTLESLPPETFALQWKQFLTSVAGLLLQCDGPCPNPDAVATVRSMVQGVFDSISKENLIMNSNILLQYHCRNLETQVSEDVDEAHWAQAVASLGLSPEQCKVIATAYDVYMGLMQKVVAENNKLKDNMAGPGAAQDQGAAAAAAGMGSGRSSLDTPGSSSAAAGAAAATELAAAAASPSSAGAGVPGRTSSTASAGLPSGPVTLAQLSNASYTQHMAMMKLMLANFARHSSAVMWLASLVFGRLLSEVQFAKLCLHSWPYLPCGQSLMRLVAQKVQQGSGQPLSPQVSGGESGFSGLSGL